MIEKGYAKVDDRKGLQIIDEFSLKKIAAGQEPDKKIWFLYSFYECPFHKKTLDDFIEWFRQN